MPDWDFYYENGKFFFRKKKNYEIALDFFNTALTKKPNHADCLFYKGSCLAMLGKSDEAYQNISQALCINPHLQINYDNPDLLVTICALLEEHRDYNNALTFCSKAIPRFPKNKVFIIQKSRIQDHLGLTKRETKRQIDSSISGSVEHQENKLVRVRPIDPFKIIKTPAIKKVPSRDNHEKTPPTSEVLFLFDYHPKKDKWSSGINPKHDFNSSKILNLKHIDDKNEVATAVNKKYVLSKMDIDRITYFAEQIEPLIQQYKDLVICVMPKSKKTREPSGIRMVAKKVCQNNRIDGTDIIDRPVDREPRHVDGNRDYNQELDSLQITDNNLIKGKTVLLLDDVKTQGNSLKAGKKLLLTNGASKVILLALGKTYFEGQ